MSKSITPATAGTDQLTTDITKPYRPEFPADRVEKTRTRKAKQLTAVEIIKQFAGLELEDKLKVKTGIEENIKSEEKRLQEQLKMISGNNEKE